MLMRFPDFANSSFLSFRSSVDESPFDRIQIISLTWLLATLYVQTKTFAVMGRKKKVLLRNLQGVDILNGLACEKIKEKAFP